MPSLPQFGSRRKKSSEDDPNSLPIDQLLQLRQLPKSANLQRALKLFKGESSDNICREMAQFIQEETQVDEILFLRMYGNISEEFEIITPDRLNKNLQSNKKFYGMPEAIYKRLPILLEKGFTSTWKSVFKQQPEFLIIIPVTVVAGKVVFVMGTAVLAFYGPLPPILEVERTWHTLLDYLQLTLPLLVNVKKAEESERRYSRIVNALEALSRVERDIHSTNSCLQSMATEMSTFLKANHVQVLMLQQEIVEEKKLHKCCIVGSPTVTSKCPDKTCHDAEDLKINPTTCVGYVAASGKPLRANQPSDLANYGLPVTDIHSVGGCFVPNILIVPISDHSGEAPVIVEISEKIGGFTYQDEEQCVLFAKRASAIISSSILLDYKKKAIRRHGIRNEVLANIGEVSITKVKQMLDLKFQYSRKFRRDLMDFRFTMRIFPDHQSPGVILYMFIDLGFVTRWQMRKSTLVRYILSMQQGYRDIPYHNWKHACCVTHFAYLLLKKLELVKHGYLTELEALSLFISCLAHDIDHRGRNNHFNLCTKSELYHLYKQEDSIMERHHIAVALSVLNTEDCNILQSLTDEEYREFLELIQWNILATDLAKYMHNRFEYFYTLSHFEASSKVHRKHLSAIIMTCADLCDNTKRWDANLPTVKTIFQEFFAQGDDEVALGLKPMEMMDRRQAYKIPDIEIQFIHHIVRPAYHALADLLPHTKICLHTLDYFEDLWLISTSIFDENRGLEDPLTILDMKEMKEESLKRRNAPQLQNLLEKHGIPALSIAHIGIRAGSHASLDSMDIQMSGPEIATEFGEVDTGPPNQSDFIAKSKRRSSIPLPPPIIREKLTCCEMVRNWMCCYLCRHRGLVVARAVRKFQLEGEFLEERANDYDRRYSLEEANKPQEELHLDKAVSQLY